MSSSEIIVGFVVSTIGFSVFLYGKRQARLPQLLLGIALMAAPFLAPSPVWTLTLSGALVLATWLGLRAGLWA